MWLAQVVLTAVLTVPPAWQLREKAVDPADPTAESPGQHGGFSLHPVGTRRRQTSDGKLTATLPPGAGAAASSTSRVTLTGWPSTCLPRLRLGAAVSVAGTPPRPQPAGPCRWVDDALSVWHTGPHIMRATDGTFLL